MKTYSLGARASTRGLTLIELVVVLAILVALAGLIIGNFPSLLRKASGSTSANTIQDISRAMSIRYTTRGSYASGFDSLLNTSGSLFSKLPAAASLQITASTPTAADATALYNIGVQQICHLDETAADATWSVSITNNLVSITNGPPKLALASAGLFGKLVPNNTTLISPFVYLMGVGKVSTLIGPDSTLLEAPTRTGTSELDNSANFYQRYCVAFLIDGAAGNRRARFLGAVAPAASGFELTEDAQKTYSSN